MRPFRVLVPTRGSAPGLRACRVAAELVRPDQALVRLLTVLPEDLYPYPYDLEGKQMRDMPERLARVREATETALAEPRRILEEAGHSPELSHRFGSPPAEILSEVHDWEADLVVMGQWVARLLERWVVGSVFDKVMRHTYVPVLLVKYDPARERSPAGLAGPSSNVPVP